MKIKLKHTNGITLIALVITIIIILILAGITIAALTGENGLLKRAISARDKYNKENALEQLDLVAISWETEKTIDKDADLDAFLEKEKNKKSIDEYLNNGNGTYTIIKNGYERTIDIDIEIWDGQSASENLEGNGTPDDPFKIKCSEDLIFLAKNMDKSFQQKDGTTGRYQNACYEQVRNVYLNDASTFENWGESGFDDSDINKFLPSDYTFYGHYEGNNYKIIGLYINKPNENNVGLFKYISPGFSGTQFGISNLKIEKSVVIGNENVGMIAGDYNGSSTTPIARCSVNGKVICNDSKCRGSYRQWKISIYYRLQ